MRADASGACVDVDALDELGAQFAPGLDGLLVSVFVAATDARASIELGFGQLGGWSTVSIVI
jgi:hypothetical protein